MNVTHTGRDPGEVLNSAKGFYDTMSLLRFNLGPRLTSWVRIDNPI